MPTQDAVPAPAPEKITDPRSINFITKLKSFPVQHKVIAGLGVLIALCLIALIIYILQSKPDISKNTGTAKINDSAAPAVVPVPENAIAKVGEEFIYQKDLDVELANYSGNKDETTKKLLTEKLVKDSMTLQAARKENMASVSAEIYNNDDKNYGKRFEVLRTIETKINSRLDQISGTMISVWFYNMLPGKIGVEKGKAEAFKRISDLHKRVVSKEITIEQAANLIKNDPSYEDLDYGYAVNALVPFKNKKGEKITFDEGYNNILWKTNPGEITDVYLASTVNEYTHQNTESYYVFGQIKDKIDRGNSEDFAKWLENRKGDYEVTYY
jgi:hypothetical protein